MDLSSSHQLLRVPAEALAQACRKRHKQVEKELESTLGAVQDALSSGESLPAASVDGLVKRLQGLKRKVEDGQAQEEELLQRCRMRLDYVQTMQKRDASPEEREAVRTERLQRLVADYLLREGYDDSARHLAQQAGIEQYLDFEPFLASRSVLAALKVRRVQPHARPCHLRPNLSPRARTRRYQAHDCEPALTWCAEHRAKLKKAGSTLELKLRLQQFVEMVRSGRSMQALAHARAHLSTATEFEAELRLAMGALALGSSTKAVGCARLFDAKAWEALAEAFQKEQLSVLAVPSTPPLLLAIGAGLTALKTPACFHGEASSRECPVCNPPFKALAQSLPAAQRSQSSLVCRLSGLPMNEDNPPLVLPSGYVYSQQALLALAADNGVLQDPQTREAVRVDQLRKAFFM